MESDLPLVNTSDLNQYLYCPRRLYYLMFYHTQGLNFVLADGRSKHAHQSRRGQWYREMYLRSDSLHLHGKIDLLEGKTRLTPVERKHGTSFFDNDEVQLAAYCMLLEDYLGEPVRMGYIYLFGTNERYAITITDWHRDKVLQTVEAIRSMSLDKIPDFAANASKCEKCSTVQYCLPEETRMLEEESTDDGGPPGSTKKSMSTGRTGRTKSTESTESADSTKGEEEHEQSQ